MIQKLEDFRVYNAAVALGEEVWKIVMTWDYFQKDAIGKQLVKAVDSIAVNLSEGLGGYHYKEIKNFSYYSRGSLFETKTWLTKANKRKLIKDDDFLRLINDLELVGKMLNSYINTLGPSTVDEPLEEYKTELRTESPTPSPNTQVPIPEHD